MPILLAILCIKNRLYCFSHCMKVRSFITHKLCEHYADCQDRFSINEDTRTIAVSDGMSQSIFPDYWAEILSNQYANEGHCDEEDRIKLCSSWLQRVEEYRDEQVRLGKNPWKLNNFLAAHKGAGATICGIRFENATDWKGDVLGDSCIIEIDIEKNTINILSSEEKAFDYYPDYYDSFPEKKGRGIIKSFSGEISPNKLLLLVSDPFSEFIYKNKTDCKDYIQQILQLSSHSDFCTLVDDWREKGMHNDDSTLCVIEFDNSLKMNVVYKDDISILIKNEEEIVESLVAQEVSLPNNVSSEQKQEESFVKKNLEGNKTVVPDKLQVFYTKVLSALDSLLNKKKGKRLLPNREIIKKQDIIEIRNWIAKEYERLTLSE